eukprot:TRINITY_DN1284_c0_g1_i2.p1 TRINITY_DN1284_c0_g1~~TRINITY_DN1284_c0_g1_i2.p1  ORF type:complete len:566 (+),score=135.16 TRINITY_DN1284_c0_g1_i2:82-1779(+)
MWRAAALLAVLAGVPTAAQRPRLRRGPDEAADSWGRPRAMRGGAPLGADVGDGGDMTLRQVLTHIWQSWPHTTANLRTHTYWDKNPRKTEWAAQVGKRLLHKKLPALRNALKQRPEMAAKRLPWNRTLLHYAAWAGATELVPQLLESGADVTVRDSMGHTAMHKAAIRGFGEILMQLIKASPRRLTEELADFSTGAGAPIGAGWYKKIFGRTQRAPITDSPPRENNPVCPDGPRGGGWKLLPDDGSNDRCDLDRRSNLSPEEFYNEYFLKGRPVLLRRAVTANDLCPFDRASWKKLGLLDEKKNCGPTAYPSLTSQKYCQDGKFTLEDIERRNITCKSDPTPYAPYCVFRPVSTGEQMHTNTLPYSLLPQRILDTAQPAFPPLGMKAWKQTIRFQFFFGGTNSGAALHWHRDAYSALFAGEKTWFITPPAANGLSGLPAQHWLRQLEIPHMPGGPMTCRQQRGDVLVLPSQWGHATLNHGLTLNIGNLWSTQHSKRRFVRGRREVSLEDHSQNPFFFVRPDLNERVDPRHERDHHRQATGSGRRAGAEGQRRRRRAGHGARAEED